MGHARAIAETREGPLLRVPPRLRPWLIAVALAYAGYLLAGNLFLDTALAGRFVNAEPERFHGRWRAALTLWPGDLMVWNLDLGGHAHHHLWTAHADFAHGRFAIVPLFHHQFRMHALQATGLRITRDDIASDMPSKPYRPDAWTFRFDRIASASLRELRVDRLRVIGRGTAAFGFVKQIHGGPWQLFDSHVHFDDANVAAGDVAVARTARVDLDAAIPPHRHAQVAGTDVLGIADAALRVDGEAPALSLRTDPKGGRAWTNGDGKGRLSLALRIAHGDLQPGGRLHWDAPLRLADANGRWEHDGRLVADARVDAASVAIGLAIPGVPRGAGSLQAALRMEGRRLPLSGLGAAIARTSGSIDFAWRFTSLRWIAQAVAKAPWLRLDGAGEIVAALRLEAGKLAEGSRADIPVLALEADVLDDVIEGHGRAQGRLVAAKQGPAPRLLIDLDDFRIAQRKPHGQTFVNGRGLQLELTSDRALGDFPKAFQAHAHFAGAGVPELAYYNRHLPGRSLRFVSGSGSLASDLAFDVDGHVLDDRTRLASRAARFAFAGSEFTGDLELDAHLFRPAFRRHHFVLDGSTLALRNVMLDDPDDHQPRSWWAKIALGKGVVEHLHPLRLQAHVGLDMQDIRLLVALFGRRRDFPAWVLRIVDQGEVRAEGDLALDGNDVVLDHVVARNDRFELLARLHASAGRTRGDLYVHDGPLGLGVELRDGQRKLHVAGAREWFDAGSDLLPLPAGTARVRADDDVEE